MNPCKRRFLLETFIFRCYVSFREGTIGWHGSFWTVATGSLHISDHGTTRRATWGPNCVPQVSSSQGVTWVEWDTLTLKLTARLPLNRCIYLHLVDFYGERKEQQNNHSTKTHKSVSFPSTKAAGSKNHGIRSVRTWWRTVCSMKPPGEPRFSTRVDPWKWS